MSKEDGKGQGPFKEQGVKAVDLVGNEVWKHIKKGVKIKRMILHPAVWNQYARFVKKQIPLYDFSDDTIELSIEENYIIPLVKGSSLMIKPFYVEIKKEPKKIILLN